MRMAVPEGRVAYEPNSLDPGSPRENPARGFASFPDPEAGPKTRQRPESFADHYSQARQFWRSMTPPEQSHIVSAFTFELSKVETLAVRTRMLGHLDLIEPELGARVATAMNMTGQADTITPAVKPRVDLEPSPALSIVAKAPATSTGRSFAALVTEGSDGAAVDALGLEHRAGLPEDLEAVACRTDDRTGARDAARDASRSDRRAVRVHDRKFDGILLGRCPGYGAARTACGDRGRRPGRCAKCGSAPCDRTAESDGASASPAAAAGARA